MFKITFNCIMTSNIESQLALTELGRIWIKMSDRDIYTTFQVSGCDTDRLLLAEQAVWGRSLIAKVRAKPDRR